MGLQLHSMFLDLVLPSQPISISSLPFVVTCFYSQICFVQSLGVLLHFLYRQLSIYIYLPIVGGHGPSDYSKHTTQYQTSHKVWDVEIRETK